MTGGSEINTYPDPNANLPGFRNIDVIDIFGTNQYVVVMTSGVYFTNDITANPIVWSQLGTSTSTPANICNVRASVSDGDPSFYIQANNCNDARPLGLRELWRIDGASSTRSWTQINPPGGAGGFGVFAVDPVNPDRLLASHLQTNADPAGIISTDGGQNWSNLPDLDSLMTANGVFRYRTVRGPTNFTSVNGYPQPTMFAFDPNDSNIIVAGGADSGIFLSEDAGSTWTLVTDPIDPVASGKPHISRPQFAYFDHEPQGNSQDKVTIYIGTKGRGIWRLHLNLPSP
jgi:hypothetical protein